MNIKGLQMTGWFLGVEMKVNVRLSPVGFPIRRLLHFKNRFPHHGEFGLNLEVCADV